MNMVKKLLQVEAELPEDEDISPVIDSANEVEQEILRSESVSEEDGGQKSLELHPGHGLQRRQRGEREERIAVLEQ